MKQITTKSVVIKRSAAFPRLALARTKEAELRGNEDFYSPFQITTDQNTLT